MTLHETTHLIETIKVAYPIYKLDAYQTSLACDMWYKVFSSMPFPIMEQALVAYITKEKYPPTIASVIAELQIMYHHAIKCAQIHRELGDSAMMQKFSEIAQQTQSYADIALLGTQNNHTVPNQNRYQKSTDW